jgi:hypothetical protein
VQGLESAASPLQDAIAQSPRNIAIFVMFVLLNDWCIIARPRFLSSTNL